ncbi:hypothetical protein L3X38_042269 [Prunus dulcis]|uniref:Uncharacterized protein n=1 Tax=Prunus dulcis TaxID=3755 RepID=A0AAD4UU91_PRUDU|nr:hypothetical protein L3X38_042269 [Prunus dulcis]
MLSNRVGGMGNRCRTTSCVLSTGTRKYVKATGNRETGQPPVHSNQAGNWERGKWPSTSAVKSSRWLGNHCRATNYGLRTGTGKYLKQAENEKTGQPPVKSNRAGVW